MPDTLLTIYRGVVLFMTLLMLYEEITNCAHIARQFESGELRRTFIVLYGIKILLFVLVLSLIAFFPLGGNAYDIHGVRVYGASLCRIAFIACSIALYSFIKKGLNSILNSKMGDCAPDVMPRVFLMVKTLVIFVLLSLFLSAGMFLFDRSVLLFCIVAFLVAGTISAIIVSTQKRNAGKGLFLGYVSSRDDAIVPPPGNGSSGLPVYLVSMRAFYQNSFLLGIVHPMVLIGMGMTLQGSEDTLQCVVAHESGHHRMGHMRIASFLRVVYFLLLLVAFYCYAHCLPGLDFPSTVLSFIVFLSPVLLLSAILFNGMKRRFEFSADRYAVSKVGAEKYLEFLAELDQDIYQTHRLHYIIFADHPYREERMEKVQKIK